MKKLFNQLLGLAVLTSLSGLTPLNAANLTWDADPVNSTAPQDGPGIWDTTTNTWWDGANNVAWDNVTPANAIFGAGSGAAGTVSNGVAITVGNITFNAPGSGNYTLTATAANPMTLSGTPSITANADAALNVVLAGTGFTKEGAAQLSLRPAANNTYTGTTIVNNGRLALNSSTTSRILIPGDLTINNGATVTNTGSSGPVADTATVTVNTGGTYASGSDAIGTLVLNGGTVVQNGTETLTVGNVDARSGAVVESTAATAKLDGNLTKTTSGSVVLVSRGSANAAGLTNVTVNGGNLILDYTQSSGKINDTLGTLTINGGALVFTNGTTTETLAAVTLAGGVITNSGGTSKLSMAAGTYDVRAGAVYSVLSGAASLTKTTSDTVILAGANDYSIGTLISGGVLQLGNGGSAGTAGSTSKGITNNATLVFNRSDAALSISGVISGTGNVLQIGSGTVAFTPVNSYQGTTTISNGVLTIDSDATLGDGTGTLNLSGGTLSSTAGRTASSAPVGNPINLTADSAITTISTSATVDFNMTNNSIGGSAGTLTISNAATAAAGIFQPRFSGSGFNFTRPVVIANGPFGTTRLDSFNTTGTTQTFSGAISGTGGYRRTASVSGTGGTTVLSGNNTYTGNTDVNQGVLVVNGTLGASAVTVAVNGTLGGNGTINGPVTVNGTLSPGASIGTLTISNTLTFQSGSTHNAELNKTLGTNDLVRGLSTVTYAGTLVVNNLSGTLVANDTFKLFSATAYAGAFTTTNLPALDPGLAWDTTGLTNNGTITVVNAVIAQPTLVFTNTGGSLQFSWTGSFKLQSQTNNLATGLTGTWGDYPGGGTSPVTVSTDPASPTVFFRLISTP